jgi:hypothetical protein
MNCVTSVVPIPPWTSGGVGFTQKAAPSRFVSAAVPFVPLSGSSILHLADDTTPTPKNQKTYRRLFGMIYFRRFGSMLVFDSQPFTMQ